MVQLRLYLKELKDFLNTVTIKDTMLADSMLTTWVKDEFQETVANNPSANPCYRALMGDYILFEHSAQLRKVLQDLYDDGRLFSEDKGYTVQDVLDTVFPLTTRLKVSAPLSGYYDAEGNHIDYYYRDVRNKLLYRYCNEVPIISSYDDTYKIPFAKEFLFETGTGKALGLRVHSSTSVVYRIPNERYNTLLSRYPKSSAVIHAIVYPIPIDIANTSSLTNEAWNKKKLQAILNAEDMSMLTYDASILEQQERQSIIDCMTTTLDMIRRRYNIREFGYENLYAPAHYYLLWQILYLAIFVQRIQNIHTGDAHLYHIWNYLKSNGFEDYRNVLSLRQQKFIYKNLPYLLKHKGTEQVFEILDYVFFHTQNISLYGKNTIQTTAQGDATTVSTTKKYPLVKSIQIGKPMLDGVHNNFDRHARFEDILHYVGQHAGQLVYNDREEYHFGMDEDLPVLYQKEKDAGLEYQNDSLFQRSTTRHTNLLTYSPISHRNTKILEMKNNNTVDYIQAMYTKFIGETILYRLSKENLDFLVEIQLPDSAKRIELPIQEWVGLIFYALNRSNGTHFEGPPDKVWISWPYDLDLSDDEWQLPETFTWHSRECQNALNLATLVSSYQFGDKIFYLSDDRQEIQSTDRFWVDSDGDILRYNHNTNRWNIVDKNEMILYRSAKVYSPSVNLQDLGWYSTENEIAYRMIPIEKTYLADFHMPRYNRKIRSAAEFAQVLHNQAIGFVIMNLEAMHDESAIHRAAYHAIMLRRCIGKNTEHVDVEWGGCPWCNDPSITQHDSIEHVVPIELNFFGNNRDGSKKTYKDYLSQESTAISNLNIVLERYDMEEDSATIYSRMADEIIMSLLPEDDPYIPSNVKTSTYRYQKLVDLFKNMTAYNLAYIKMQYADVDSTKVSMNVSSMQKYKISNSITDNFNNNQFEFKTSTIIKNTMKPQYPDQDNIILFSGEYDDSIKQSILDHIDRILEIYDTKRLSKTKKHNKIVALVGEEVTSIVEAMTYVQLQNIQNAVHVVNRTHVFEVTQNTTTVGQLHVTVESPDKTEIPYDTLTIPDAEVHP